LRLEDIVASRKPAVSIEFFPPKTPQGEKNLAARLHTFRDLNPSYCSVTYGAAGSTRDKTLWWVDQLRNEFGFEVMCHVTCVGQSRDEIRSILNKVWASGIENIIALRGDPPQGEPQWRPHPDGFEHAVELVREAKRIAPFSVAVAGFPETHPEAASREADLVFLKNKVDAGADVIITQMFFDNAFYFRFVEEVRRMGIKVPVIPGVLPIRSAQQARRFATSMSKSTIPSDLEAELAKVENDPEGALQLGIDYATRQCAELVSGGAPGLHFYCLNESHSVEAILRNLKLS
jgi:methylenetetrahydrofolate reductase (NADPH)